jgi:predicted TIM-barrel fold metal-dependent hydrolase
MTDKADLWLDQVKEDILDPQRPIIDPHHHLWRHPDTPYLLDNLWADTQSGHNVRQTVFIECGSDYRTEGPQALKPVGETEFVSAIAGDAANSGSGKAVIGGIVGHGDLLLGEGIEAVLVAHLEAAGDRFKGIRHSAAWDASDQIRPSHSNPPSDLYERPQTLVALQVLGRMGLSFDAWNYHPFIPRLTVLADKAPQTQIILDHFGGPIGIGPYNGKRNEIFDAWSRDIEGLAKCPNVTLKLGGMAMPVNGWGWHNRDKPATSDELALAHGPYYDHAINCFGPDRCMFESNFPVDRRSLSYPVLWNAFKKIAAPYSEAEKSGLFEGTARRVYKLQEV